MSLTDLLFPASVVPKPAARKGYKRVIGSPDECDAKGREFVAKQLRKIEQKREETRRAAERTRQDPERRAKRMAYTEAWRKAHPERVRAYRRKHNAKPETRLRKRVWVRAHYQHKGHPRGEAVKVSKLTADQVRSMRALYAAGGISMKSLGNRFGVSFAAARKIIRGITWRHIDQEGGK